MMYLAMRGDKRIVEGTNLEQVVIAAEAYSKDGAGDIVVWNDGYIIAEIEEMDSGEPYTTYTGKERGRLKAGLPNPD